MFDIEYKSMNTCFIISIQFVDIKDDWIGIWCWGESIDILWGNIFENEVNVYLVYIMFILIFKYK